MGSVRSRPKRIGQWHELSEPKRVLNPYHPRSSVRCPVEVESIVTQRLAGYGPWQTSTDCTGEDVADIPERMNSRQLVPGYPMQSTKTYETKQKRREASRTEDREDEKDRQGGTEEEPRSHRRRCCRPSGPPDEQRNAPSGESDHDSHSEVRLLLEMDSGFGQPFQWEERLLSDQLRAISVVDFDYLYGYEQQGELHCRCWEDDSDSPLSWSLFTTPCPRCSVSNWVGPGLLPDECLGRRLDVLPPEAHQHETSGCEQLLLGWSP